MNCRRFDELFEVSTVSPVEADASDARDQMGGHMAECPDCRARLQNYVITTQALRALAAEEDLTPPPPLPEPLVQRVLGSLRAVRTAAARGMATG